MCLLNNGYENIEDLIDITDIQLKKIRNLNEKGIEEIRTVIKDYLIPDTSLDEENNNNNDNIKNSIILVDETQDSSNEDSKNERDISCSNVTDNVLDTKNLLKTGELSKRVYICLKNVGITNLLYFEGKSIDEIMKIPKFGKKSFQEIYSLMEKYEVSLKKEEIINEKPIGEGCNKFYIQIETLKLSIRCYNCLKEVGVNTIQDILNMAPKDFSKIKSFDIKTYDEMLNILEALGIDKQIINNLEEVIRIRYKKFRKPVKNDIIRMDIKNETVNETTTLFRHINVKFQI